MVTRRDFLKLAGLTACAAPEASADASSPHSEAAPDAVGMLTDITLCVGCRSCEAACNAVNGLPEPERPFDDLSVLETPRRMDERAYTVVNRYPAARVRGEFVNVKFQCMHCVHPACVSACLLGALQKTREGPVIWAGWRCMGCRYCMVACPFEVPAYEYEKGIGPRVMKCTMCYPRIREGKIPACAEACPMQAITFGPRAELLELARKRIRENPGRYVNRIYGEHEVGGTSWLYLAPQEFESLGFLEVPDKAPPELTESIQHGILKYFIPPVALYAGLGALMYYTHKKARAAEQGGAPPPAEPEAEGEGQSGKEKKEGKGAKNAGEGSHE